MWYLLLDTSSVLTRRLFIFLFRQIIMWDDGKMQNKTTADIGQLRQYWLSAGPRKYNNNLLGTAISLVE